MKPHYRLHFHLFDGKTPLWWVTREDLLLTVEAPWTTGGYVDPANAIREAAKL